MTGSPVARPIVLFDGVCNLCEGVVRFIVRRDSRSVFRFAPLQSRIGQLLLEEHGISRSAGDTFVLVEGRNHWVRSDAALRVTQRLPGAWPLVTLLRVVPRPWRDRVYSLVVRNRYRWFGRKATCVIPSGELRDRFLS
jgi:predicted DCC family thiol-disulfide oxidoreductase YuxK